MLLLDKGDLKAEGPLLPSISISELGQWTNFVWTILWDQTQPNISFLLPPQSSWLWIASSLCHKNRNLKDYKLQSRPSLKTAILLCHAQVAIGPPFLAVRDALLMDVQLLNVIPGSVLTHRALSAGEPQLYGKGKPKEELFVTGGQKAGFSLLLVGTSCQLILGQGKAASKQKVCCTRREKSNFGGASVCIFKDSFNVIFFFFWCFGLEMSEKSLHKKMEN